MVVYSPRVNNFFLVHITVINLNMTHIFVRYQIIDFWFREEILTTQLNISNVRFYFEMLILHIL